MKTVTDFIENGDRYQFDFKLCTARKGFAQMDTRQDAWYYGNWSSPRKRQLVSYAEGDVEIRTYDTDVDFVIAVRDFVAWAGEGFKGIDTMCNKELTAEFIALGLGGLLH